MLSFTTLKSTIIGLFLVIAGIVTTAAGQSPEVVWQETYRYNAGNMAANFLAHTNDGDFLVAGIINNSVTHLSKVARDGEFQWRYTIGSEETLTYPIGCFERVDGTYRLVALKNIGIGIGGGGYKSPFIIDLSVDGDSVFANFDPKSGNQVSGSKAVSVEEEFIKVVGSRLGANPPMLAVGTMDKDANMLGFKDYSSIDSDSLRTFWAARSLRDGSLVVAGQVEILGGKTQLLTLSKLNADDQLVWDKRFAPGLRNWMRMMIVTQSGEIILAFNVKIEGDDRIQMALMKLDQNGEQYWQEFYPVRDVSNLESVYETSQETLVLVGSAGFYNSSRQSLQEGSYDAVVLHVAADGEELWQGSLGAEGKNDAAMSVLELENNNFLLGGFWKETDMFLAEIDLFKTTNIESMRDGSPTSTIVPQPVAGAATVEIQLHSAGMVELQIIDHLGRVCSYSSVGYLPSGSHKIDLPTTNLARGTYHYLVSVDNLNISGSFVRL